MHGPEPPPGAHSDHHDQPPDAPAVRVRVHRRHLEVAFDPGFTFDDVAIVKAIRGRKWIPDRRVWTLPDTPAVRDTLAHAMGDRLIVTPAPDLRPTARPGKPTPRATPDPSRADPAADPSRPPAAPDPTRPHGTPDPSRAAADAALLDTLRRTIRTRGYSGKTEKAYVAWTRRFLRFHAATVDRPDQLDASHARGFLEHLATARRLAAGSRNQAAAALSFMFREILGRDELAGVARAKGPKRVPMVLTHREVIRVLREMNGKYYLVGVLLYSAGLRLDEALRLRVKDIDFELHQILVRDGKGGKDRYVPLAHRAAHLLRAQIESVAELNARDRANGDGWAPLPRALHRKDPGAGYALGWQYLFPASTLTPDPATGRAGRGPLHSTAVQREVKAAVGRSGIPKRATCHTFRHSFATETLRGGCDIRVLQSVLGHKDLRTTSIYLHVVEQSGLQVRSPLDRPDDPDDYGDFGRPGLFGGPDLFGGPGPHGGRGPYGSRDPDGGQGPDGDQGPEGRQGPDGGQDAYGSQDS